MIIFVEGCDRTGKSTLCKLLKDSTHASKIIHCSKPKTDDPFQEYLDMLLGVHDGDTVIFDRGYLGEFVYSNLWRGGCKITPQQFALLDKVAKSKRSVVIHAYADTDLILERCKKDGEDLLKPDQVDRCKDLFAEIMDSTSLPVFHYDSGGMTPEDCIRDFINFVDAGGYREDTRLQAV